MTLVQLFDKLFQYMPPLQHKHDTKEAASPAPTTSVVVPDDDPNPLTLHERIVAGRSMMPPIPGPIGAGGLSPTQQAHVRQAYNNPDMVTPQFEAIAKKAISTIAGSTGAAIAGGESAANAFAAGISSAGPAAIVAIDAAALGIAVVDMFGGDVAIPTYAPLSPEFDATTAAGQFHAREEAKVINSSLAETGGAVKFRSSGQLTDNSVAADLQPDISLQQARTLGITASVLQRRAQFVDEI